VLGATSTALLAVQDGMTDADIGCLIGPRVGVFVGGSTEWKEKTIGSWSRLSRERGAWCHVGRVNTHRRIEMCLDGGAHSFDGSSASRFAVNVPGLDRSRRMLRNRQRTLFEG
jgi:hypothetical protein